MVSDLVPRTLPSGVVWDEAAQARFVVQRDALLVRGLDLESADREARWSVEGALCRARYRRELENARACVDDREKRALYARWQREYGPQRAAYLARVVKSADASKAVASW